MKKVMIVVVLVSGFIGLVSSVQAHPDWSKDFWEQQDRNKGN